MGKHLFYRLAKEGIRKNRQTYFPYYLTCIIMVMMDYMIVFLASSETLGNARGGAPAQATLGFGVFVVAIFATYLLVYTHSFLMKQRKKEFGLYYILGLNKQSLLKICGWETLINGGISLAGGLFLGILFSKAAELCLLKLIGGHVTFSYKISVFGVLEVLGLFAAIFFLQFIGASWQVLRMQAVNLLHSDKLGEKPPKGNVILALGGAIILGVAYYLAVSIEQPVKAIGIFFIAVIMVIVATYLLFIAGSVFMCNRLKKKKGYYYKANHFVSVSSMSFRMNRNGAGLASICILSTMVLVTMATTVCLYLGVGEAARTNYPKQVNITATFHSEAEDIDKKRDEVRKLYDKVIADANAKTKNKADYVQSFFIGERNKSTFNTEEVDYTKDDKGRDIYLFYWMSLEDYNRNYGQNEKLADDEVLMYDEKGEYTEKTVRFDKGETFRVRKCDKTELETGAIEAATYPYIQIIGGKPPKNLQMYWHYEFDTNLSVEENTKLAEDLLKAHYNNEVAEDLSCSTGCYEEEYSQYMANFGSLLFLGCLLSVIFLVATVLIIYYKQVAEGYEDVKRFDIMKKVGMTEREIKKSINSQLLLVFFIPLVTAGIHLTFAFPLVEKIVLLMGVTNHMLLAKTSAIGFCVFALIYMVVYKMTANEYYKIVR